MKFIKKHQYLIISILLTIIFISMLFYLKGIYPFGKNTFNIIDFDHAYIPVYYKLWDVLHGHSSIFIDWNLGTGLNCFGSLIMNSLLLPSSLIIGLFERGMIPYAMSYVIILKLITITICTYISLNKLFPKLKGTYKMLFTLFYTFSGYTSIMLSSLLYLDAIAIFPLFILAYYRLMKENKWLMYVITLTLVLLLNYYMAWMYLFFIFGITIITALTLDVKDKKKKCVEIVLLTLVSLGLSCILFFPSFYQTLSSYRMTTSLQSYASKFALFSDKIIHILPLGILFALTIKQLLNKNSKKINLWIILLLIYTLIGIFIEPINVLWHTGSYSDLPFRYSFIPTFILIISSSYYCNQNENKKYQFSKSNTILSIIVIAIYLFIFFTIKNEMQIGQIALHVEKISQIIGLTFLFIISIAITFIILKTSTKTKEILLINFGIITIFTFSYMYINQDSNNSPALNTQKLSTTFSLKKDNYNYVNNTKILNINFPYILQIPSMENRLHFIKEYEINFRDALGYLGEKYTTPIYSNGGNLFTNALMQNKYYFSNTKPNYDLYDLIDYKDEIYYYQSKYNLEYLIPYSGKIYNEFSNNEIENTNNLYKELFNQNDNIIDIDNYIKENDTYKLNINKDNIYYIYIDFKNNNTNFEINTTLDNHFINNNRYYITFTSKEQKDLEIKSSEIANLNIGHINIPKYINFIESLEKLNTKVTIDKNTKTYEIDTQKDTSILIPINYDDAFTIKINDKITEYKLNAYNMISIDVPKGQNKIELTYIPKHTKTGIVITLTTLIILIFFSLTNKKIHYLDNKRILYPLFSITVIIGLLFILKVYILSWLF